MTGTVIGASIVTIMVTYIVTTIVTQTFVNHELLDQLPCDIGLTSEIESSDCAHLIRGVLVPLHFALNPVAYITDVPIESIVEFRLREVEGITFRPWYDFFELNLDPKQFEFVKHYELKTGYGYLEVM